VKNFVALPTSKNHYSNEIDPWFTHSHPEHDAIDVVSKETISYNKDNNKAMRTVIATINKVDSSSNNNTEKENIIEIKPDMNTKLNDYRIRKEELISTSKNANLNKRVNSSIIQSESKRIKSVSLEKKTEKNVATSNSSKLPINTKNVDTTKPKKKSQNNDIDDFETKELIKQFNLKRLPKAKYEPPRHSVRLVRQWEKISGKLFANLNTEEREQANTEILKMKENL
jgi:hypothetical protein